MRKVRIRMTGDVKTLHQSIYFPNQAERLPDDVRIKVPQSLPAIPNLQAWNAGEQTPARDSRSS